MNKIQKEQVLALHANGESCGKIAENLGLSINTIKSFCRRNSIKAKSDTEAESKIAAETIVDGCFCPQCGNKITQIAGRKTKKFCSDKCRVLWWNSHIENVRQKAVYSFKCTSCGKDFTAYGNAKRRYCSHSCYCESRFKNPIIAGKVADTDSVRRTV